MRGPGCIRTGSLSPGLCGPDKPAGSRGSTEPSSDGPDLVWGPPAHTGSGPSCWTRLWGEKCVQKYDVSGRKMKYRRSVQLPKTWCQKPAENHIWSQHGGPGRRRSTETYRAFFKTVKRNALLINNTDINNNNNNGAAEHSDIFKQKGRTAGHFLFCLLHLGISIRYRSGTSGNNHHHLSVKCHCGQRWCERTRH